MKFYYTNSCHFKTVWYYHTKIQYFIKIPVIFKNDCLDQLKTRSEEKGAKKRDRSFFSELRERLSRRRHSKRRARSCDLATGEIDESVSLPPSRDISRTRFSGNCSMIN